MLAHSILHKVRALLFIKICFDTPLTNLCTCLCEKILQKLQINLIASCINTLPANKLHMILYSPNCIKMNRSSRSVCPVALSTYSVGHHACLRLRSAQVTWLSRYLTQMCLHFSLQEHKALELVAYYTSKTKARQSVRFCDRLGIKPPNYDDFLSCSNKQDKTALKL